MTFKAPQRPGTDIDALVARYAPVGRRVRRERVLRRSAVALAVPVLGAMSVAVWQWNVSVPDTTPGTAAGDAAARVESALEEFRQLKAQVSAETGALSAQRKELATQRERFEQHNARLLEQLDAVNAQGVALASQIRQFEEQRIRIEQSLARVDAERRQLDSQVARASQTAPGVTQQLAEIDRQRRSLEEQQQEVRKQGQLLAQEIQRINTQRLELERQRETIEQQRAEVQALLNQIREVSLNRQRSLPDSDTPEEAIVRAQDEAPLSALATMAAVDDGKLGEMRGGIDVGQDFAVSIGVTRTGSINGIEQFSSALYVDDLMKVNGAGLAQIDAVMIQNGSGNFVSPEAIGNLAPNVATIIQNTMDNQALSSQTVMDISLQNVSQISQGMSASQAVSQSLSLQR